MKDKISIIMACYNCEKTLRKSIDSVLAQTYTNWIMICCDDGSTDGTLRILNDYKEKYPDKFVVIQNDGNRKLPYSLNHCLEYVDTEFVARMDADDWSLPDRFEKQLSFLKEHPEYDLVGTAITAFDGTKKVGSIIKPPEPNKYTLIKQNAFNHATIMTYKRVYDELNGYSLEPYVIRVEDADLWFRFMSAGFRGYNLPDELYAILEDIEAVKRRTFKSRINEAKTKSKGLKLLGFSNLICYMQYLIVLKGLIPTRLQQVVHNVRLNKKKEI